MPPNSLGDCPLHQGRAGDRKEGLIACCPRAHAGPEWGIRILTIVGHIDRVLTPQPFTHIYSSNTQRWVPSYPQAQRDYVRRPCSHSWRNKHGSPTHTPVVCLQSPHSPCDPLGLCNTWFPDSVPQLCHECVTLGTVIHFSCPLKTLAPNTWVRCQPPWPSSHPWSEGHSLLQTWAHCVPYSLWALGTVRRKPFAVDK